ncbi:tail fiber protein [Nitrospirillum iridis]|uniref:Microcystin-dependent protein n=1 Tax=Nitrospirillum iridis TaxID=765888 RepID=A0A7X0B1L2_9PROT|nr:tail fiber protein [Nitrospirillum iridis]MBB6253015.1 microcystin-dependent protein [Nitrospirillum iridis]
MPLESASYVTGLDAANPYPTDPTAQGDDHIRMLKAVLLATFPKLSGALNVSQDDLNGLPASITALNSSVSSVTSTVTTLGTTVAALSPQVATLGTTLATLGTTVAGLGTDVTTLKAARIPSGSILMWAGSSIPTGWVLCDGSNGTPDLRGRFILGGSTADIGKTGGASTATTGSAGQHSHSGGTGGTALTVDQIPSHSHGFHTGTGEQTLQSGFAANAQNGPAFQNLTTDAAGGGKAHTHTIPEDGAHTHTVSVLPPYYTLVYIMKT